MIHILEIIVGVGVVNLVGIGYLIILVRRSVSDE